MIEKLVLGGIWTGDLPIFNPDALTSAPSWQAVMNYNSFLFKFARLESCFARWKPPIIFERF